MIGRRHNRTRTHTRARARARAYDRSPCQHKHPHRIHQLRPKHRQIIPQPIRKLGRRPHGRTQRQTDRGPRVLREIHHRGRRDRKRDDHRRLGPPRRLRARTRVRVAFDDHAYPVLARARDAQRPKCGRGDGEPVLARSVVHVALQHRGPDVLKVGLEYRDSLAGDDEHERDDLRDV